MRIQGLAAGSFIFCNCHSLLDINCLCFAQCTLATISLNIYKTVNNSNNIPSLDSGEWVVNDNNNKAQTRTHKYVLSKTYPWVQKFTFSFLPDRLLRCITFYLHWVSLCLFRGTVLMNISVSFVCSVWSGLKKIKVICDTLFTFFPISEKKQRIFINVSLSLLMAWTTCFNTKKLHFSYILYKGKAVPLQA